MNLFSSHTKEEKVSFCKSVKEEQINSTRVVAILGAMLFVVYSFIDLFGLPNDALMIIFPVRALNLAILGIIFALTFSPIFTKYYTNILMFGYFSSGVTISVGVLVSQAGEYTHDLYFAAMMILIITAFTWTYLPIKNGVLISLTFISSYLLIKVFFHNDIEGVRFLTLLSQFFYLISVTTIAATGQLIRDNLIYKNLNLQESLQVEAEVKAVEAKKQEMLANMDELTGIHNRRYINENLKIAIEEAKNNKGGLTLVYLDLNGFKLINDKFGHDYGDKVLQITAERLSQIIRLEDYLARIGGDEFLVGIITTQYSPFSLNDFVEKVKKNVSAPIVFKGEILNIGTSLGCASYPKDGDNVEKLINYADKQMYEDKQKNKKGKMIVAVEAGNSSAKDWNFDEKQNLSVGIKNHKPC